MGILGLGLGSLVLAQGQIGAPVDAFPKHNQQVISPPGTDTEKPGTHNRESESERNERLVESEIVPPPEPPPPPPPVAPPPPTKMQAEMDKLKSQGVDSSGALKPLVAKTDINFGSWWSLREPAGTEFVPDFSYGTNVLFGVSALIGDVLGKDAQPVLGAGLVTYNGAAYVQGNDMWGSTSSFFAETNSLEAGIVGGVLSEFQIPDGVQSISWDFLVSYLPVKWVKAVRYSDGDIGRASDASTHRAWGWGSFGVTTGLAWGWAGIFDAGPFVSVQSSVPFQMRIRSGIRISLYGRM